jgi:NHLM bacteriocin system ABC transporter peptidase/ATP-binding protein
MSHKTINIAPPPAGNVKRKITPTILQMEAVECGSAALAIVLGHYKCFVTIEELRTACGVSRDGSKASNIVRAARSYGMNAKGHKMEPASVFGLTMPAIVFWDFNHFLVVEGYRNGTVYLNDPARGPRTVPWQEFDRGFTGVALEIEPGPGFVPRGSKPSLLPALKGRLRGSRTALVFAVLTSLMLVVPGLLLPTFIRVFIDDILITGMQEWVRPLFIGMVMTICFQTILFWTQQYYLTRLETKIAIASSGQFFWHVIRLPVKFFTQRYAGEIGNRVNYCDQVASLLSGQLATAILNMVMIVFYALVMLQYDVLLTLIGIVTAGINLGFLRIMTLRRADANQRLLQERGKMDGIALGGIQIIETLKASGGENDFFSIWSGYQAKAINEQQNLGVSMQLMSVLPQCFLACNSALILGVGGLRVMSGGMTIGELIAFNSLIMFFLGPVNQLVSLGGSLQDIHGLISRLDDVLRHPIDETLADAKNTPDAVRPDEATNSAGWDTIGPGASAKLEGRVTLREISFGYSPLDSPLIENFSVDIKPGSRVALVGGSGSGKSTVSRIIAGIQSIWEGEVLFDGKPREAWPRALLNQSIAMVDQDIFLFEGSIRDNLTLWDRSIPESDLITACQDACIYDLVISRPGGLDSLLLELGSNLSGGQRQRLEIARALTTNPSILILDEATSALDPITEKVLDANLRRRGCTCIIVAHRLSTIRNADEIIVLDKGKVVQRGTHDEMKQAAGAYSLLIRQE